MKTVPKTFYRNDGLKRIEISEFEMGGVTYFTFDEETWFDYEHESFPHSYWGPGGDRIVRYYETAEAAEANCIASTPWLREINSN